VPVGWLPLVVVPLAELVARGSVPGRPLPLVLVVQPCQDAVGQVERVVSEDDVAVDGVEDQGVALLLADFRHERMHSVDDRLQELFVELRDPPARTPVGLDERFVVGDFPLEIAVLLVRLASLSIGPCASSFFCSSSISDFFSLAVRESS
jgi:hypothetical protein